MRRACYSRASVVLTVASAETRPGNYGLKRTFRATELMGTTSPDRQYVTGGSEMEIAAGIVMPLLIAAAVVGAVIIENAPRPRL